MAQHDPLDLKRFVDAQESSYESALAELRQGRKQTHWMWFIFPQLRGLGRSSTAQYYGLSSLAEARAYLDHPILGQRLDAATVAATNAPARSLNALFGSPDDMKFKSSMTLFERAAKTPDNVFALALDKWCGGQRDTATLQLLA
ncbi:MULTISPECIES: DUF1810 domain-containing protein [Asticcacaulis]|uniref:DUF1810 domain-containing protein n=1 Tax=Asticcacaulis TaxID=76890 RepID=UPI001AE11535|nr:MULTISPECIES: DUF1810 domain-containing protein [Asticcacaulis]MBP2159561.1 uncharacterized protein (DUF1810 family) [Asticcacaulis solisilvae]MDR6800612.1 uncharacterized protein (DUF1810 family) [Asticcacaulis sp. BE141]